MSRKLPSAQKSEINNKIKANGQQAITGSIANEVLINMFDSTIPFIIVNSESDFNSLAAENKLEGSIVFIRGDGDGDIEFVSTDGSTLVPMAKKSYVDTNLATKQDQLTNTDSEIQTAVNKASHSNRAVLDAITAAYTTAEQTKLSNVEAGATKNQTNSYLLSRTNHTGTQTASTISNFNSAVSANSNVTANTATTDRAKAIKTVTGDTTVTETDHTILVDASSGDVTITLTDPTSTKSLIYNIKKIDSTTNTVTFATPSGQIEFGNNIDLTTQGEVVNIQHNGTNHYLVA